MKSYNISLFPVKLMPYQAEFFIGLREIEKVLPFEVQEEIKQDIQLIWETDSLDYVNITSALDRGGRVPLPLPGHYEGQVKAFYSFLYDAVEFSNNRFMFMSSF